MTATIVGSSKVYSCPNGKLGHLVDLTWFHFLCVTSSFCIICVLYVLPPFSIAWCNSFQNHIFHYFLPFSTIITTPCSYFSVLQLYTQQKCAQSKTYIVYISFFLATPFFLIFFYHILHLHLCLVWYKWCEF